MSERNLFRRQHTDDNTGYAIVGEMEALKYARTMVGTWKPASDTLPLRHGMTVVPIMTGTLGLFLTNNIRTYHKMGMGKKYRVFTLALATLPGSFMSLGGQAWTMRDIVLGLTPCPICVQTRAVALQLGACMGFTVLTTMLANLSLLSAINARHIPDTTIREVGEWCRVIVKRNRSLLLGYFVANVAITSGLTMWQQRTWLYMVGELDRRLAKQAP